jgi:hypothetical protein
MDHKHVGVSMTLAISGELFDHDQILLVTVLSTSLDQLRVLHVLHI